MAAKRTIIPERPIVVVSNRLPFTFSRSAKGLERKPSPGGLVSALDPMLRKRGGTWIGWPGIEIDESESVPTQGKAYRVVPVLMTDTEISRYYHGFSNRTLWPLLHSMPARARFERRDWDTYVRVNHRFGDAAVAHSRVVMRGDSPTGVFNSRLMMIHVWVEEGGQWRLAAHQTTKLEDIE